MAKRKAKKSAKRLPKVRIPLPFDKAVEGMLGLSAADAKAVRESHKKKK